MASSAAAGTADLYSELGVKHTADAGEIKAAFRRLSKELHPDTCQGDPEESKDRFIRVVAAYNTLSDPIRRAKYDAKWGFASTLENMFSGAADSWSVDRDSWGAATEMWDGSSQVSCDESFR
jgi:curved DNA-binding protein CbpA